MTPTNGTETASTESFSSFRSDRGSAAHADVSVAIADPSDTGADVTKESAKTGQTPTSKAAPATDPVDPQEPQDGKNRFDKRMAEKQRKIDELTRQEQELNRRIAAMSNGTATETTGAKQNTASAPAAFDGVDQQDPKPKPPDQNDPKYSVANGYQLFEDDRLAYAIAMAKWDTRRENRVEWQRAALEKQQKAHKEALESFESRGSDFSSEHEDYPDLVDKFKRSNISNETAAVIVDVENGPAILYELMNNPAELKRIEDLPYPINRLRAVFLKDFLIEYADKLNAPEEPATPKRSAAPAVGTRTSGTGPGTKREPSTFASFRKEKFG
jgi:hypothetical protein